jgi:hypothetical protein
MSAQLSCSTATTDILNYITITHVKCFFVLAWRLGPSPLDFPVVLANSERLAGVREPNDEGELRKSLLAASQGTLQALVGGSMPSGRKVYRLTMGKIERDSGSRGPDVDHGNGALELVVTRLMEKIRDSDHANILPHEVHCQPC